MKHIGYPIAALIVVSLCAQSRAVSIQYRSYVDDYIVVKLDGNIIMNYDGYPAAHIYSEVLDLSQGWHNFEITYRNRWGSNSLWFAVAPQATVPLENYRSYDASGNLISGLRADYYSLDGIYATTVYGEGPINHGWSPDGTGIMYEGVISAPWGGIYNGWDKFEERLTGQIYVGDSSEPAVPGPLASAAFVLGFAVSCRRRK